MNEHLNGSGPDLTPVAAALDRLGAHERAAAPSGLEPRIHAAVMRVIRARRAMRPEPAAAGMVIGGRRFGGGLRTAAAVLIAAGLGAAWLAGRSPAPTAMAARDDASFELALVAWLDATPALGEGLGSVGEKIDVLFADTATLGGSFGAEWTDTDLFDDGGAM